MIPAAFEYHRPASVDEALQLLQRLPDAKLLAGGHSLLPMMKLRVVSPPHVIDLSRLQELRGIREESGQIIIGALTTHWEIESSRLMRDRLPLFAETAARIGDIQVRNAGTVGGNLVHADPAADYPATVLVLEAEMVARGAKGPRVIPAGEFFTGVLTSAVAPDEVLTEVRVPIPPEGTGTAYLKFAHPASGFAVVGVAAWVRRRGGRFEEVRVSLTGVGPTAYRARGVEHALAGQAADEAAIAAASEHAADGVEANEDVFATATYRCHLARVFTKRALRTALERAGGD
ncbi:MAG TPA: xanthine dehydrogenase family protein subunit M [bacterium]|nr:xanthine dehydrogenase family protein subunit M [bacterium]